MAESDDLITLPVEKRQKVDADESSKPNSAEEADGSGSGSGNNGKPLGTNESLTQSLNGVWKLMRSDKWAKMSQAKVSELEQKRRTAILEVRTAPNEKQQARVFCGQLLPSQDEEFKTLFTIDKDGCTKGADGRQKVSFSMRIDDPFDALCGFRSMDGWVWVKQTPWTDSTGSPVLEGAFDFDVHHRFGPKGWPDPYGFELESFLAFKSPGEEVGTDQWEELYDP